MGIGRIRPGKLGSYIKITCYEAAVGACRLSFASVRREYCGDGGPGLRDLALADMPSHHDTCLSSPDGPKGGTGSPSGIPAIPRYGNGAPAGKTCFANPRLRPPCPDSVRPAPQAHSGTRPVPDAQKTRSAQTGFLLCAVTGLRSSTHSNGEDAVRMSLVRFHRANAEGCCRSLPASDPSPSEVRIPEASFESRVSKIKTQTRILYAGFAFRNSLHSFPRLGSDREQASYSLRSPLRGRTPCVTPLRYVPAAGYSEGFTDAKRPARVTGRAFLRQASGVRRQASGVRRQASGVRRQASGVRRQASGVRRQASGVARNYPNVSSSVCWAINISSPSAGSARR